MPRQARIDAPGALHHIIGRGIERREIFWDEEDRDDFLRRLEEIVTDSRTRCYAWALIPNHFHLLLRTGDVPVATVMRRLLSGYAGSFNRRHHRSGHLFQNRYKSILCQEDIYLKELVRYIHLNPLRAGVVSDLEELDRYRYCGHSPLLGNYQNGWQETASVLALFSDHVSAARRCYSEFVVEGMYQGRRPDLMGGGLLRSAGGWQEIQSLRKAGIHQKSDERILGDSDFVENVLARSQEMLQKKYTLAAKGLGFEDLLKWVSQLTGIPVQAMIGPGKERRSVRARSLLCFWAVKELDIPLTDLARRLNISVPTVSIAVQRGGQVVERDKLEISAFLNAKT
jgi:REP element-mobilizing transposase RayT